MTICRVGILEIAQRDPASVKFSFDDIRVLARTMPGGHPVGLARLTLIQQLAGDDAPLDPPFFRIDQQARIARCCVKKLRRLARLVLTAQPLGARKKIGGIAMQFGRNGIEKRRRIGRLADDGCARTRQRQITSAQPLANRQPVAGILLIKEAVHPRLVVSPRHNTGHALAHKAFERG